MKIKIKSEFIHITLSVVITLIIVCLPLILGNKIMWKNYTDCNELTPIGYMVSSIWVAVLYIFVFNGVHNFLKMYSEYD